MSKVNSKIYLLSIVLAFLLVGCAETVVDKYFERPEWLAPPIYDVLEEEGRFGLFLNCVDSTEYAKVLKGAGLYTVFAPNDSAMRVWMQKKSYATLSDIPADVKKKIVAYSIIYSKWPIDKLAYRFVNNQYELGAFKRKSAYYTLPYQDAEYNNNWVVDQTSWGGLSYTVNDYQLNLSLQNYKYLPVYTYEFFQSAATPLTPADYNTFYPDVAYTGKNVQGGTILTPDIRSENGIIHEVSSVNEPQENIANLLKDAKYSSYTNLLNAKSVQGTYLFRAYKDADDISPKLLTTFQKMVPQANIGKLYVKTYSAAMGFSPVMENVFAEDGSNDTEKSGNTVFVPSNEALDKYLKSKILKYYPDMNSLPNAVLQTLINTHMATGLIWPTLFEEAMNSTGEYLNGEGSNGSKFSTAGIIDKQIASNGFIYLIDHVLKSRYFETVYSEVYLNPDHHLLNLGYTENLREDLMKSPLNGYNSERWTTLNFSDRLLKEDGFGYDDLNAAFTFSDANLSNINTRLQRLINMHVFPGLKNADINSEITGFSSSPFTGTTNYNGWGYLVNNYGDMIRYKDGKLQAAGNIEDGTYVTATKMTDEFNNGYVFNIDKMLQYSPRITGTDKYNDLTLWTYLARAKSENPNVSMFVDYVEKCLKNTSGELAGVKTEYFYTVLMPNNTAMTSAQTNGYLPTLDKITSDNAAFDLNALATATAFVNAHFLQGQVLADDGLSYIYPVNPQSPNETILPTLLKITNEKLDLVNKATQVRIVKYKSGSTWLLRFEPQDIMRGTSLLVDGTIGTGSVNYINGVNRGKVNTTTTDNFRSNRIACKGVLHEITNFIRFQAQ
ncbi:MAG: fasciclin domain-containing protein [Paludibacter sp.]